MTSNELNNANYEAMLTAYALGELDDDYERKMLESQLERDPSMRAEVEAIRSAAQALALGFASEAPSAFSDEQRSAILDRVGRSRARWIRSRLPWVFQGRAALWRGGLLAAAACVGLLFIVLQFWTSGRNHESLIAGRMSEREMATREWGEVADGSASMRKNNAAASDWLVESDAQESGKARGDGSGVAGDGVRDFEPSPPAGGTRARGTGSEGAAFKSQSDSGEAQRTFNAQPPMPFPGVAGSVHSDEETNIAASSNEAVTGRLGAPRHDDHALGRSHVPETSNSAPFNVITEADLARTIQQAAVLRQRAVSDEGEKIRRDAELNTLLAHLHETRQDGSDVSFVSRETSFLSSLEMPVSVLAVHSMQTSFDTVRYCLDQGVLPPPEVVRIEDMLNYFCSDGGSTAKDNNSPLAISIEINDAPWAPDHRLVRVTISTAGATSDRSIRPDAGTQSSADAAAERSKETNAIARDVKLSVEFNPAKVQQYRLIGYEHSAPVAPGSHEGSGPGGQLFAGQSMTALYELVPANASAATDMSEIDQLAFQKRSLVVSDLALLAAVSYKSPDSNELHELKIPVKDDGATLTSASQDFRLAAAVAAFGMILRDSPHKGMADYTLVNRLVSSPMEGKDSDKRREFLDIVNRASIIQQGQSTAPESQPIRQPR